MEFRKIPKHVSIIPDGNRRWAKEKGMIATAGHVRAGEYGNLKKLFNVAKDFGMKYISIWGFSTENWKRDEKEVAEILRVVEKGVDSFLRDFRNEEIRFRHLGRKDRLPASLVEKLERLEEESKDFEKCCVLLCLDYGGRDEIIRAVNKAIEKGEKIDEESFCDFLDTHGIPEPELVIRTGGDKRLSGWMLYQTQYSEFYFTDVLFPDFDEVELKKAIRWFCGVERRFGGN